MTSPTKRVYTSDIFTASRSPGHNINLVSDDLTARLQNIGARVRKCVSDGYTTSRFTSVPPTPFTTPVKGTNATLKFCDIAIFRSSNDTLNDVFLSPVRDSASPSPSPSPRKRGRSELDEPSKLDLFEDITMESDDDEEVMFIMNTTPTRPIRPLKRKSSPHTLSPDYSPNSSQSTSSSSEESIHTTIHSSDELFAPNMLNQSA